jgi:hypothetical protein
MRLGDFLTALNVPLGTSRLSVMSGTLRFFRTLQLSLVSFVEGKTMANIKYTSLIILVALLIGTSAWAVSAGTSDIPMSNWVALGFGSVFTIAVGCGLIALLFFSSRRGYDERAFRNRSRPK